jgi:hypothetical protein
MAVVARFLALLDGRGRQVVILLNGGLRKLGDVAAAFDCKNHSPVSKRLVRMRVKVVGQFDLP